jgi:hypothetical protein
MTGFFFSSLFLEQERIGNKQVEIISSAVNMFFMTGLLLLGQ